nr:mechanosensitive ion channel family protein [Ectothiorhodospira mobilis]
MLAPQWQEDAGTVTKILLWGSGAWLVDRGLRIFLWEGAYRRATGTSAPTVLVGAAAAAIYTIAALIVLTEILQLDTGAVLLSTGLVAGVLSVAMQNTITDFFSGVSLSIDRPYQVGDWIEFEDGVLGEVVGITWRSTRIRSWHASLYVVPNKKAANSILHNYDRPTRVYGYWFHVSVVSTVSPLVVRQLLQQAALQCERVRSDPAPMIYFCDPGSVPYKYMVYVHFDNYPWRFAAIDELSVAIHQRLQQAGISPAAVTYELQTRRAEKTTAMMPGITEILRDVSLFAPLTDAEIGILARGLSVREAPVGERIVAEGDEGDSMLVLVSGVVILSRTINGHEREIERLKTGQCFGEMSLLTGEPRYSTARALTNVWLIEIPRTAFAPLLARNEKLQAGLADLASARRKHTEAVQRALFSRGDTLPSDGHAARIKALIREFFGH